MPSFLKIAAISVCAFAASVGAYTVAAQTEYGEAEFAAWKQAELSKVPAVQDAKRRWAKKSGSSVKRAMSGREIELMEFPQKTCIQFVFSGPSVGEIPIYCYAGRAYTDRSLPKLVEEYSDGE